MSEVNFNRMTIRESGEFFVVLKMKASRKYSGTGGGYNPVIWFVPVMAKPKFIGTYAECFDFIVAQGAQYTTDHKLPLIG